ncbi:MAG: DUF262 domain-containing protein [Chitinophagales bacterium]
MDEEKYWKDFNKYASEDLKVIVKKIVEWVRPKVDYFEFGNGSKQYWHPLKPITEKIVDGKKKEILPFDIWAKNELIQIPLTRYKGYYFPMNENDYKQFLVDKLNKIEGLYIPHALIDKRPNFKIKLLAKESNFKIFIEAFDWFYKQVEKGVKEEEDLKEVKKVIPQINEGNKDIVKNTNKENENKEDVEEEGGVEITNEEDVLITAPFNPNDIKISTKNRTIHTLKDKLEFNEINLFTVYQRRPNLWKDDKKSRLIESILLGIPIPAFYFEESESNVWQVVDGLQRVSTIKHFILGNKQEDGSRNFLVLKGLEFLKDFEGKAFADLPRNLQRRITNFDITIYIIETGTPEAVKYNLFKRINTEGLVLTPQEIRHALNQGVAAKYVEELAKLDSFKKATDGKVNTDRMQDRDFVTRFLAFHLLDIKKYDSDLDAYLHQIMVNINNSFSEEILEKTKIIFDDTMRTSYEIFGKDTFRKRQDINDRRKPINKALFDSISVNLAQLSTKERELLIKQKDAFRENMMEVSNKDVEFWHSISTSTGQKSNVQKRFKVIKSIINDILPEKNA